MKGLSTKELERMVTYQEALEALENEKVAAIGFGLIEDDRIICIDIDMHDEDKLEKFEEINREVLGLIDGYAEVSSSGKGTHVFGEGTLPFGYKNKDRYGITEIYNSNKFILVTGDVVGGRSLEVLDIGDRVGEVLGRYFDKKVEVEHNITRCQYEVDENALIEKVMKTKKGKAFFKSEWQSIKHLINGSLIQRYPSQSEADFAFITILLYYNGNNTVQAEKIFRASPMFRESKHSGYVAHQVSQASLRLSGVYDWNKVGVNELIDNEKVEELINNTKESIYIEQVRKNGFRGCSSSELNKHITKYILTFGCTVRNVFDSSHGDYDSASNGVRFYHVNKDELFYDEKNKVWLKWDKKKWDRVYSDELLEYAEKVFHQIKHEAYRKAIMSTYEIDEERKEELESDSYMMFKYASKSKNKRNCIEMIEFSRSHFIKAFPGVRVDANINALNLQNGVFDFDEMKFVGHDKKYYQTRICNVEYKENAPYNEFDKFLQTVLPNTKVRKYL